MKKIILVLGLSFNAASAQGVLQQLEDAGKGGLEKCDMLPSKVQGAKYEAQKYRRDCGMLDSNASFVVNDYSCEATGYAQTSKPYMYIFDSRGNCMGKTAVSYGMGNVGRSECPKACADGSEHFTPPGFHYTVKHDGARYDANESFLLVGLEGQNSAGRAILIHPKNQTGAANTYGCSGVSPTCISEVMALVGEGALVYNYFGSTQLPPSCNNKAGLDHTQPCRKDWRAPAPAKVPGSNGRGEDGSAPTSRD
jgi:hypothetical protein